MILTALLAVLAPWTPVETEGTAVKVWGRSYEFASNALPVRVKSQGRDLLAGPMRIVCADAEGRPVVWQKGGSWIHESDAESATVCAWQQSPAVFANVSARVEFDGMAKVKFEPYWENGITATPESVKASVYRRTDGRSLYVVSNLSPDTAVEARVTDPKGTDFSLRLEPFRCQLIEK